MLAKLKFMAGAPGCAAEAWAVADDGIALLVPEDFVSPIRLAAAVAAATAAACWLNGKMNVGACIMFGGMGEDCCASRAGGCFLWFDSATLALLDAALSLERLPWKGEGTIEGALVSCSGACARTG